VGEAPTETSGARRAWHAEVGGFESSRSTKVRVYFGLWVNEAGSGTSAFAANGSTFLTVT
jgi:hypothetical protein